MIDATISLMQRVARSMVGREEGKVVRHDEDPPGAGVAESDIDCRGDSALRNGAVVDAGHQLAAPPEQRASVRSSVHVRIATCPSDRKNGYVATSHHHQSRVT